MPKEANAGAITIRPPTKGAERKEWLQLKDLMDQEIEENRAKKSGPTSYAALFREMALARYPDAFGAAEPADEGHERAMDAIADLI